MEWSVAQKAIFAWFAQAVTGAALALVVRARAGTGKTTTILEAIKHAPERRILLAAFNKVIADELNHRLSNPHAEARTLHSVGNLFIYRQWGRVKVDAKARARGLTDAVVPQETPWAVKQVVSKLHTKAREVDPFAESADDVIRVALAYDCCPDPHLAEEGWTLDRVAELALDAMRLAASETPRVIDFADMIYLPLACGLVRPTYDLIVVDEAQDMTKAQLEIAERALLPGGRIVIVGDNRQAIYGFRGADSGSLDRLKEKLGADELPLTTTYRCGRKIVALAAEIVPDFEAGSNNPEGEIQDTNVDKCLAAARPGDFVLSRTNAPLARLCLGLLKRGTPARIRGRDISAGIMALVRRFDARDIGELLTSLQLWHDGEVKRAEKLDEDEAATRLELVTDQRDLIIALTEGLTSLRELEARMETLFSDNGTNAQVTCSTVHKAKGLEAERVWVLSDTFRRGGDEEDNIRYVAITRAKLTLVWVRGEDEAPRWAPAAEGGAS